MDRNEAMQRIDRLTAENYRLQKENEELRYQLNDL